MALPRITSPHATGSNRTQQVMLQVLLATVPGILALTWLFGAGTLFNLLWASLCALGFEAALLAGGSVERDFELVAQPDQGGLQWVAATPRQKDGTIQRLRAGFRGRDLAVLEIVDSFGQRSVMEFADLRLNVPLAPERFRFVPPAGAEVIEQ